MLAEFLKKHQCIFKLVRFVGQTQPAIKHKVNSLQIFSNSLQSVFTKRQTELFIIHSDKEMLLVLADTWKDIIAKHPIFFHLKNGSLEETHNPLRNPLAVF